MKLKISLQVLLGHHLQCAMFYQRRHNNKTPAQRFALPALGRGRRSRPTGKMIRRKKLLEIFARIPSVRCTLCWQELGLKDMPPKNQNHALNWLDFTHTTIFYKPDFVLENETDLPKRQSRELAETFAKNWLCKTWFMPEKINLAKKLETNLPNLR